MFGKENPQTSDDVIQIKIAFDIKTNRLTMNSKAPTTLLLGILETAKMIIIQNQVREILKMEATRAEAVTGPAPAAGKA